MLALPPCIRWLCLFAVAFGLGCSDPAEPEAVQPLTESEEVGEEPGPPVVLTTEESPAPPPVLDGPCPQRMAHIPWANVCIDRYEAIVRDGVARSEANTRPTDQVTWFAAAEACTAAGFRLCSRQEWQQSCEGAPNADGHTRAYPYGDQYRPGLCNTSEADTAADHTLQDTGSMPGCRTPEGVFDLSGNLNEWFADADATGMLRDLGGGSFSVPERETVCVRRAPLRQPPETAIDGLGFRCCTTPLSDGSSD